MLGKNQGLEYGAFLDVKSVLIQVGMYIKSPDNFPSALCSTGSTCSMTSFCGSVTANFPLPDMSTVSCKIASY